MGGHHFEMHSHTFNEYRLSLVLQNFIIQPAFIKYFYWRWRNPYCGITEAETNDPRIRAHKCVLLFPLLLNIPSYHTEFTPSFCVERLWPVLNIMILYSLRHMHRITSARRRLGDCERAPPALDMKVISVRQDYCVYMGEYRSPEERLPSQMFYLFGRSFEPNASVCLSFLRCP